MEILKDFILYISFILFPIFLYHTTWLSRPILTIPSPNKPLIAIYGTISSILCVVYPVNSFCHFQLGLQSIPIFSVILYGGYIAGVIVLLFTLAAQIVFDDASLLTALPTVICALLPFLLHKQWNSFGLGKKFIMCFYLGAIKGLATLLMYVLLEAAKEKSQLIIWGAMTETLIGWGIFTGILLLSIYATEFIKENALMRKELVHTEKITVASELAASVAHEVRNPLTVVRGFIQLLFSEETLDQTKKDYKNLVLSELDRAQEIITNYLDLAKQQYYQKEVFDFSLLLKETVALMTSYANYKSVTIKTNIKEHLMVYGDKTRLKQVIINLLKNGIEAVDSQKGTIDIQAYLEENKIFIIISDNGVGMSPEQMTRLGEPYFTLKQKGTGLGLTVSFSIIANHHGMIHFQSNENGGTKVTVTIPANLEETPNAFVH
jgi:two-component system sporulation sensor kinase B